MLLTCSATGAVTGVAVTLQDLSKTVPRHHTIAESANRDRTIIFSPTITTKMVSAKDDVDH
jgi:hypothetical protein